MSGLVASDLTASGYADQRRTEAGDGCRCKGRCLRRRTSILSGMTALSQRAEAGSRLAVAQPGRQAPPPPGHALTRSSTLRSSMLPDLASSWPAQSEASRRDRPRSGQPRAGRAAAQACRPGRHAPSRGRRHNAAAADFPEFASVGRPTRRCCRDRPCALPRCTMSRPVACVRSPRSRFRRQLPDDGTTGCAGPSRRP